MIVGRRTFLRRVMRLVRDRRAVAAVEFALILPFAVVLYLGAAQVADAVMTSRKTSTVTRTLADLMSRQSTSSQSTSTPTPNNALTSDMLNTILASSATLLTPEPLNSLTMTVSAIDVTNTSSGSCCSALVRWSYTQAGSLRPCNVQLTATTSSTIGPTNLPAELLPTGTTLPQPLAYLIADVYYRYQPMIASNLFTYAPAMQRTVIMLPRTTGQVVTGTLPASGSQFGKVCY